MNDLTFMCLSCGNYTDTRGATVGCECGNTLFKVARIVFRNPYRDESDFEDGYKVNNPGTAGQIGESGLGTTKFRGDAAGEVNPLEDILGTEGRDDEETQNNLPQAGSEGTDFGVPGAGQAANDEKFFDGPDGDYNPLEPINLHKEPYHVGPHNMNDLTQNHFLRSQGDLFEHIRRKRKGIQ